MPSLEKLFVYGTLKKPEIQEKVIGRKIKGLSATLADWRKSEIVVNGHTYHILIPDAKSSISGKIIEITESELKLIDAYETESYLRIKIDIEGLKEVWIYVKPQ